MSDMYELDGPEALGSFLQIQASSDKAPDLSHCSIQWYRVSSEGGKRELISAKSRPKRDHPSHCQHMPRGAIRKITSHQSVYAPEPFDVGRVLQADIVLDGYQITLATAGPIDPAAGLGSYVEALVRKHDTEFNNTWTFMRWLIIAVLEPRKVDDIQVVITQMNGADHPSESIHVLHVGKMRIKLCKGKATIAKEYYSTSMQLCGVRGGGNAATQALYWQAKKGLSFVLAFESERDRNAAIMLARRFAFDCNIMLAGPDDRAPQGT
ncbi:Stomatal closure-related actin-binding protein 1 [Vitis vinifera]|uniref:Stomatal closure-related actin-binding protein 1 n=1 Tax=Vitis vinifera TaxID=29760 RepID=A0A438I243_VITVI|nr:Stomatal closure-related actin-binding protein 1 [Vitis vinifera]